MADPLTDEQIESALEDLDGWSYDGQALHRGYEFGSFMDAIAFINRLASKAERANHHPEILNMHRRVELRLRTHSADAVTEKDLDLARSADALAL